MEKWNVFQISGPSLSPPYEGCSWGYKSSIKQKEKEWLDVEVAYTVIDPRAVVVHPVNAVFASAAMVYLRDFNCLTFSAFITKRWCILEVSHIFIFFNLFYLIALIWSITVISSMLSNLVFRSKMFQLNNSWIIRLWSNIVWPQCHKFQWEKNTTRQNWRQFVISDEKGINPYRSQDENG